MAAVRCRGAASGPSRAPLWRLAGITFAVVAVAMSVAAQAQRAPGLDIAVAKYGTIAATTPPAEGADAARRACVRIHAGDAALGRALYQGTTPYAAGDAVSAAGTPAAMLACARCHGAGGEGRSEGGTRALALRWAALRHVVSGYADDAALAAAITRGVGRDGRALDAAMPRFALERDEARALLAYLALLGSEDDRPRGVADDTITLGTVLPLSGGSTRIGEAVIDGLREAFAAANAAGGVHGRRIELAWRDSQPDAKAALQALHEAPVYALVAGLWGEAAVGSESMLGSWQLAHVASLVVRERAPAANGWSLDLLAPLDQQAARLADALAACPHAEALGVREAGARAATQASNSKVQWLDANAAWARIRDQRGTGCIGYPLSLAATLHAGAPSNWTQMLVIPLPPALLQDGDSEGPWRRLGLHAGRLAVELLSRAGRALHERSLLDGFDRLTALDLGDGLHASFSRTRRHAWDAQTVEWRAAPLDAHFGRAAASANPHRP